MSFLRAGFLAQHRLSDHGIDVGFPQGDLNGEAVEQFLEVLNIAKGLLPCCNKQDLTVKATCQALRDCLNVQGQSRVLADELLHFVKHDQA